MNNERSPSNVNFVKKGFRKHTQCEEKPIKCKFCDKEISKNMCLVIHEYTYNGETAFK